MIKFQIKMEIEAPPEMVFDLLADHTKHPVWDPHMTYAKLYTEGPIKNGASGITTGRWKGRVVHRHIYYDAYENPKWVSVRIISGSAKDKMTYEFIPTEKGTKISWQFETEFRGFMRLLEPFIKSVFIKRRKETLYAFNYYITKNRATLQFIYSLTSEDDQRDYQKDYQFI
jgi:uncharacterized protein YndB with AHSA1/START domain